MTFNGAWFIHLVFHQVKVCRGGELNNCQILSAFCTPPPAVSDGGPSRKSQLIHRTCCLLIKQTISISSLDALVKIQRKGHPYTQPEVEVHAHVFVHADIEDNSSVSWTPARTLFAVCLGPCRTTAAECLSDFQHVNIHQHFWYFIPFEQAFFLHLSHTVIETLRNLFKGTPGCTLKSLRIWNSAIAIFNF